MSKSPFMLLEGVAFKTECRKPFFVFFEDPEDFPGSPVVKTLPSNAGGVGSIPGWRAKILCALGPKNQNIKQVIL